MYGQTPQYGYQPQGVYPQPVQPVQPAALSSVGDLLAGNSAKAFFTADSRPGDSVTGVIEKIESTQVNDFQTKQPAYWNDGKPKEQIHIIIQTQLRDPSVDDDDGRRSLWVKGWGVQLNALRTACKQAGVKMPQPGDTITETYVGLGQRGNAPQPPKLYEFRIQPANHVGDMLDPSNTQAPDNTLNAPQAGWQPQPQKGYAPMQNGPQAGRQAANQGYQPQPDRWNPQGEQPTAQQPAGPDPLKVMQLKTLGKPPQEVAALLGTTVEQVVAITDKATGHGSEQDPEF